MATKKSKKKTTSAALPKDVSLLHDLEGRLEVPSGESFEIEVWVTMDNPKWVVRLVGTSDQGKDMDVVVGQDQAHLKAVIPNVDDGTYALAITAVLQNPGARFTLETRSSEDLERCELTPLPGKPMRMDALPVRVG